jgi:hypothetical protein
MHELSSLARTLGSWVQIPLRAWMFGVRMCLFCVCVVLCLGRGLATSWSLVQAVLPSVKMIMKLKKEARAHRGCRASEKKNLLIWTSIIALLLVNFLSFFIFMFKHDQYCFHLILQVGLSKLGTCWSIFQNEAINNGSSLYNKRNPVYPETFSNIAALSFKYPW